MTDTTKKLPPEFYSLTETELFNRAIEHERLANELAAKIQAERDARPAPVEVRKKPVWYRVLMLPITVRKFERVFAAQGEPWVWRWLRALVISKVTLR